MSSSDPIKFFRSLPPAPNVDASKIKGNLSTEQKQLSANVLAHFVSTTPHYSAEIGQRMRMTETNVWVGENGGEGRGHTVCEIQVTEDMCNVYKTMHGACAAFLVDTCSSSPLISLGIATAKDTSGMSQSLNLIYHQPALLGMELKIVSTTLTAKGRVMASSCEIRDKSSDRLLVSGVHTKVHVAASGPRKKGNSEPNKL